MTHPRTRTCTAKKRFAMTTDAPTDEALIDFVDYLSRDSGDGGLDSLDLGDAMGYLCAWAEAQEGAGLFVAHLLQVIAPTGFTVTIGIDWDPYEWTEAVTA
jgi:hypothetical protein